MSVENKGNRGTPPTHGSTPPVEKAQEAPKVTTAQTPVQYPPRSPVAQPTVDRSKLMKFRLLPGVARHEGPDYTKDQDEAGRYPNRVYEAGDVVLSPTDLTKTLVNKFERLHADESAVRKTTTPHAQAQEITREMDKMSDKRLRELADEEEIDVSKCKTREELVETIRNHLNP